MGFEFKKDPIENFLELFKEAQIKGIPDANAMALASVNDKMQPSVRTVLFKGLCNGGFCFYTNYQGRKARDLEINPKVSANFFWSNLDRQIRIEGSVTKLTREQNEAYFNTRPRLSQIGAWVSNQSEELESFDFFHKKFNEFEEKFKGQSVTCPPHWGGYVIMPTEIEFWFGKSGRLHERYVYQQDGSAWRRYLRFP